MLHKYITHFPKNRIIVKMKI